MKPLGFSLIELMLTIVIFSIISAAGFGVLTVGKRAWDSGDLQLVVQQEARKAMDRMIRELRQSSTGTIAGVPTDGNYYTTITFRIPDSITSGTITWSDSIQYFIGGLNNAQLIRQSGTEQTVLANNISLLRFKRDASAPEIINIEVATVKETTNITLMEKVKLRN